MDAEDRLNEAVRGLMTLHGRIKEDLSANAPANRGAIVGYAKAIRDLAEWITPA